MINSREVQSYWRFLHLQMLDLLLKNVAGKNQRDSVSPLLVILFTLIGESADYRDGLCVHIAITFASQSKLYLEERMHVKILNWPNGREVNRLRLMSELGSNVFQNAMFVP